MTAGDDVLHVVKVNVSGLTGIIATGTDGDGPAGKRKAVVAVMRDSKVYGTSVVSKSLVKASDSKSYIAVWNGGNSSNDDDAAAVSFETEISTATDSQKRLHRNFDLIVGLTTNDIKDDGGGDDNDSKKAATTATIGAASLPLQDAARLANSHGRVVLDLPVFNVKSLPVDPFAASSASKSAPTSPKNDSVPIAPARSTSLRRKLSLTLRRHDSTTTFGGDNKPTSSFAFDKERDAAVLRVELEIQRKETPFVATKNTKKQPRAVLVHSQQHAIETAHTVARSKSNDMVTNILYMEPSIEQVLSIDYEEAASPRKANTKRRKKKQAAVVTSPSKSTNPPRPSQFRVKIVDQTTLDYEMTPVRSAASSSARSKASPPSSESSMAVDGNSKVHILETAIERVLSMSDDDEKAVEQKETEVVIASPLQSPLNATKLMTKVNQTSTDSKTKKPAASPARSNASQKKPSSVTPQSQGSSKNKPPAMTSPAKSSASQKKPPSVAPSPPKDSKKKSPTTSPAKSTASQQKPSSKSQLTDTKPGATAVAQETGKLPRPRSRSLGSAIESARHARGRKPPQYGPFGLMRLRDKSKTPDQLNTKKETTPRRPSKSGAPKPAVTPPTTPMGRSSPAKTKASLSGKAKKEDSKKSSKGRKTTANAKTSSPNSSTSSKTRQAASPSPKTQRRKSQGSSSAGKSSPKSSPSTNRKSPANSVSKGPEMAPSTRGAKGKSPVSNGGKATDKKIPGKNVPPQSPKPILKNQNDTLASNASALPPPKVSRTAAQSPVAIMIDNVQNKEPARDWKLEGVVNYVPERQQRPRDKIASTTTPPTASASSGVVQKLSADSNNSIVDKDATSEQQNQLLRDGEVAPDDGRNVFSLVRPCGELEDILEKHRGGRYAHRFVRPK